MVESKPVRGWAGIHGHECGRKDDGSEERGGKAFLGDADEGRRSSGFCLQYSEYEFGDGEPLQF
jgi:hypothetical protein